MPDIVGNNIYYFVRNFVREAAKFVRGIIML